VIVEWDDDRAGCFKIELEWFYWYCVSQYFEAKFSNFSVD
jgi:hypothetical protein